MRLKEWYTDRGLKFIYQRGARLVGRYNLSSRKSMRRIEQCVAFLAEQGCAPTFPTPGILLERYPSFIHRLQDAGVEIAVHGYQHVNLNAYPLEEAGMQLIRATRVFEKLGIQAHGFRGPYMRCSDELIDSLPPGLFSYSSNKAIRWRSMNEEIDKKGAGFYNKVAKFYQAKNSEATVCVPWNRSNLVEIPVCIPDDLQFLDGLRLGGEGLTQAWKQMFHQIYQRGELFNLLFHTELTVQCEQPLMELLSAAYACQPRVWIARLYEISEWWKEKSAFKVDVDQNSHDLTLAFSCTPRATILARGIGPCGSEQVWDGAYYRLPTKTLTLPANPRPFVGLGHDTPQRVVSFLKEQGYILDNSETARLCGIYLDNDLLNKLASEVAFVQTIETSSAPLVRFGRWPDGAKSALSITGDLDALSLEDYISRLFFA